MKAGTFVLGLILGVAIGLAGSTVLWRKMIALYRVEARRSLLLAYETREQLLDCQASNRRPRLRAAR